MVASEPAVAGPAQLAAVAGMGDTMGLDALLVCLPAEPSWWYVRGGPWLTPLHAAGVTGWMTPEAAAALVAGGTRLVDAVLRDALLRVPMRGIALWRS